MRYYPSLGIMGDWVSSYFYKGIFEGLKGSLILHKFSFRLFLLFSSIIENHYWNMTDLFMGTMAVINLIVIFLLGKVALKTLDDYTEQRKRGLNPVFKASAILGLKGTECWKMKR
jgi:AGCS family alanine or glycine:cation symporter